MNGEYWNSWTKEMNNVANGIAVDEWRMNWNSWTKEMYNVADGIAVDEWRILE